MIITNNWLFALIFALIFFMVGGFFLYKIFYRSRNKKWFYALFFTFLFLWISLFWIKGWQKDDLMQTESSRILFVLDVSKSMKVEDIEDQLWFISRLQASKDFISDYILSHTKGVYWLLIFSGEALEVLPFTSDENLYTTILQWVDERNLSKSGTVFWEVFQSIIAYFSNESEKIASTVVIFTDGGDQIDSEKIKSLYEQLDNQLIQVLIVWVGTKQWGYIPEWVDPFWRVKYKVYNGEYVVSWLNETELKNLSNELDLDYTKFDEMDDFSHINKLIGKNLSQSMNEISIENRRDLSIYLIFFAFISFLFFLWCENYYKRK